MRERQNAKSLGAVHTHTHTNSYQMEKFGHSKMLCRQSRFVGQSGELCLGKTERVFRTQKLEKTGKTFNIKRVVSPVIKLGYLEMTQAF